MGVQNEKNIWLDLMEKPMRRLSISKGNQAKDNFALVEDSGGSLATLPKAASLFRLHQSVLKDWVSSVSPLLAPQSAVPEHFMSNLEKAKLVKEGISKVSFEHFKSLTELDYNQMSVLLSAARNTLINKRGEEPFSFDISEKLVSLAEVYTHGLSVFENWEKLRVWLKKPNRALGGEVPFDLLPSHYGRSQVHIILGRIEWGVYS
jgi:putative toxin-antitoxin system antitoxin component (TIGR02293 family)